MSAQVNKNSGISTSPPSGGRSGCRPTRTPSKLVLVRLGSQITTRRRSSCGPFSGSCWKSSQSGISRGLGGQWPLGPIPDAWCGGWCPIPEADRGLSRFGFRIHHSDAALSPGLLDTHSTHSRFNPQIGCSCSTSCVCLFVIKERAVRAGPSRPPPV